jgi:rod shape-determining protein MreC
MQRKSLLLFLLVVTLSLSVMTFQSNRTPLLPLKSLNNILNAFYDMKSSIKDFIAAPFRRMLLREEENMRLKAEISRLHKEQQLWQEALQENKRLRELLVLKENEEHYVTSARVIGRGTDQWTNTFVLDKGSEDGITKYMIGVTEKGLVGKISSVSNTYSHLLLLTDIHFSVSARLQDNRVEGIVSGKGFRKCRMKYIPHEDEVKKGDIVITSGLDMLFPPGIPVGYVSRVNKKDTGIFQEIEILPFVDNARVEVVTIVKKG